ncbi:hypothetical protein STANM309S_00229 [Streptomyces tanashiensis]
MHVLSRPVLHPHRERPVFRPVLTKVGHDRLGPVPLDQAHEPGLAELLPVPPGREGERGQLPAGRAVAEQAPCFQNRLRNPVRRPVVPVLVAQPGQQFRPVAEEVEERNADLAGFPFVLDPVEQGQDPGFGDPAGKRLHTDPAAPPHIVVVQHVAGEGVGVVGVQGGGVLRATLRYEAVDRRHRLMLVPSLRMITGSMPTVLAPVGCDSMSDRCGEAGWQGSSGSVGLASGRGGSCNGLPGGAVPAQRVSARRFCRLRRANSFR